MFVGLREILRSPGCAAFSMLLLLSVGSPVVAETVNPECYEALKTFFVDLTHQKPIYPQVMLQLCLDAGFPSARIFYPNGGGFTQENYETAGEYAVIAVT